MDAEILSRLSDYLPVIWIAAALILGAIEALTLGLTTLWFAIGALAAALSALLGAGLFPQIVVFFAVSVAALYFTRPILVRKLKLGREKNVTDQMTGRAGIVTEAIQPFSTGLVKVGGVVWTAMGDTPEAAIPQGGRVTVMRVEGVRIIVRPDGGEGAFIQ
jgi:membrane protein implicated in regulation of membrane protease activity